MDLWTRKNTIWFVIALGISGVESDIQPFINFHWHKFIASAFEFAFKLESAVMFLPKTEVECWVDRHLFIAFFFCFFIIFGSSWTCPREARWSLLEASSGREETRPSGEERERWKSNLIELFNCNCIASLVYHQSIFCNSKRGLLFTLFVCLWAIF